MPDSGYRRLNPRCSEILVVPRAPTLSSPWSVRGSLNGCRQTGSEKNYSLLPLTNWNSGKQWLLGSQWRHDVCRLLGLKCNSSSTSRHLETASTCKTKTLRNLCVDSLVDVRQTWKRSTSHSLDRTKKYGDWHIWPYLLASENTKMLEKMHKEWYKIQTMSYKMLLLYRDHYRKSISLSLCLLAVLGRKVLYSQLEYDCRSFQYLFFLSQQILFQFLQNQKINPTKSIFVHNSDKNAFFI